MRAPPLSRLKRTSLALVVLTAGLFQAGRCFRFQMKLDAAFAQTLTLASNGQVDDADLRRVFEGLLDPGTRVQSFGVRLSPHAEGLGDRPTLELEAVVRFPWFGLQPSYRNPATSLQRRGQVPYRPRRRRNNGDA